MTTRIAPGIGANLLGQHSAERNEDATTYVGNLDPQKKLEPSVFKIGCSQAGKNKWVDMGKQVSRKFNMLKTRSKIYLLEYKMDRKLAKMMLIHLKQGSLLLHSDHRDMERLLGEKKSNYAPKRKKVGTDLTRENLQRGDWKELEFKEYNFNAKGPPAEVDHLHPLLKVKQQLMNIFLQMGSSLGLGFKEEKMVDFDSVPTKREH
ncbi:hypothetical protein like AT4G39280 [Hibiscus trionum]|uniref:Uncharacterized protein n=1 Tax=Hibiscus trionum TaxID=183268 RepID=A0A9W7HFK7_HIBTR|nr:hypothetical protein like AT4G39280 [Hibiscus trionum]